jgi:hypothetical protein
MPEQHLPRTQIGPLLEKVRPKGVPLMRSSAQGVGRLRERAREGRLKHGLRLAARFHNRRVEPLPRHGTTVTRRYAEVGRTGAQVDAREHFDEFAPPERDARDGWWSSSGDRRIFDTGKQSLSSHFEPSGRVRRRHQVMAAELDEARRQHMTQPPGEKRHTIDGNLLSVLRAEGDPH